MYILGTDWKKQLPRNKKLKFRKQVPVHPRDRLKRKRKDELVNYFVLNKKSENDVVFIKQVPVHQSNRLRTLVAVDEKVKFIKQVPVHPRDWLKRKQLIW